MSFSASSKPSELPRAKDLIGLLISFPTANIFEEGSKPAALAKKMGFLQEASCRMSSLVFRISVSRN